MCKGVFHQAGVGFGDLAGIFGVIDGFPDLPRFSGGRLNAALVLYTSSVNRPTGAPHPITSRRKCPSFPSRIRGVQSPAGVVDLSDSIIGHDTVRRFPTGAPDRRALLARTVAGCFGIGRRHMPDVSNLYLRTLLDLLWLCIMPRYIAVLSFHPNRL
jgi:hypothetical protein